jgi:hypothetical protein
VKPARKTLSCSGNARSGSSSSSQLQSDAPFKRRCRGRPSRSPPVRTFKATSAASEQPLCFDGLWSTLQELTGSSAELPDRGLIRVDD